MFAFLNRPFYTLCIKLGKKIYINIKNILGIYLKYAKYIKYIRYEFIRYIKNIMLLKNG